MSLRLTAYESTAQNVIFYGVLSIDEAGVIEESRLFAYALNEGYFIDERPLTGLEADLNSIKPTAVVINLDSVAMADLISNLLSVVPKFKHQTLFFLATQKPLDSTMRSFWRNFGIINIITTPIDPVDLFSFIKLGTSIINPTLFLAIDFSISSNVDSIAIPRGTDGEFLLSLTKTRGEGFLIELRSISRLINIAFFPYQSIPDFIAIMRVRVDINEATGSNPVIVEAKAGKVVRILRLNVNVT
jgi:hypothetical protein